jgi:hypothetical protein
MSFNWKIIRKKVYGIIKAPGRGLIKMTMYDERGNETIEPIDANRFFATFESKDPDLDSFTILVAVRDQGQASVIEIKTPDLHNDDDFEMVKDLIDHIRSAVGLREGIKVNWQDFDKEIDPREEAVNNIKESKDVSKVFGTTKSSFQRIGEAKLIIRHTESVNEEKHGARTRHIKALFVENRLGERFAYPHPHMAGARAFARHISNGGTNHDAIAEKIYSLSEDYMCLRRSGHALRLHEGTESYVNAVRESMQSINRRLKSMHGPKGYAVASQELLGESSMVDLNQIEEIHAKLAETCGCSADDQRYSDLGRAAQYIAFSPQTMPEPTSFTWNRRPDLSGGTQPSASDRMHHQIMELADACDDEVMSARLAGIAEMIASGTNPCSEDLDLVKEAFASGMKHVEEDDMMPEEAELDEFFSAFSAEAIFSEDADQDDVKDLEATGMDADDAEQEVHDNMTEWDEDPAHIDGQRLEALESGIEHHLNKMGVTAPITMAQANHCAASIERADPGITSDAVMDYMERRGMIMSEEGDEAENLGDPTVDALKSHGDVSEVSFISRIRSLAGI